jgi:DNA-binding transcriptional ArsR family regulator
MAEIRRKPPAGPPTDRLAISANLELHDLMVGEGLDAVFAALADPTRRAMLVRLAGGTAATMTALAQGFPISAPAAAKHVAVLERAGLVERRRIGRTVTIALASDPMARAALWLWAWRPLWRPALAPLAGMLIRATAGGAR